MTKMRKPAKFFLALLSVLSLMLLAASAVLADDGAKWIQLPDEGGGQSEGIAVKSGMFQAVPGSTPPIGVALADDFECIETGPITDICIWGSWEDDVKYGDAVFQVLIWEGAPFEQESWGGEFVPGKYTVVSWNLDYDGYFYDPCIDDKEDTSKMYRYHFHIPEEDAFEQVQGRVYWLTVVEIEGVKNGYYWGWNIACYEDRWGDDAVCFCFEGFDVWDLVYPEGHYYDYDDESMDLAFVINCTYSSGCVIGGEIISESAVGILAPWIPLGLAIVAGATIFIRRRMAQG